VGRVLCFGVESKPCTSPDSSRCSVPPASSHPTPDPSSCLPPILGPLTPAVKISNLQPHTHYTAMDTAIDLSDASKALDLANIRFQLMYCASGPASTLPH
jgi:hypothetical protein